MTSHFAKPLIETAKITSQVEHGDGYRYRITRSVAYAVTLWWPTDGLPTPSKRFRRGVVYVSRNRWKTRSMARAYAPWYRRQFEAGIIDYTAWSPCGLVQDAT